MKTLSIFKLVVAIIIATVVIIGFSFFFHSKSAGAPVPAQTNLPQNTDQAMMNDTQATSSLNKITTTSKVSADMDAYINSSNSVSNPNDFNDSYSDLNQ